ncbi:MAG: PEP-CTERM sorting domain-containing protein [Planctomycetia bacterium]|nr:PEP-CTERM sorting domain-containing protein [Planctomycetia bacterium]
MVALNENTSFSITSNDFSEVRKISAGSGMTAGNGAFFNLTSNHTLTLDLSNVQFTGGKGRRSSILSDTKGGAIASGKNLTLKGNNAIFGGTEEGEGNTAECGGALFASGDIVFSGTLEFLNNSATDNGGAIYIGDLTVDFNRGDIVFSGKDSKITFRGNKANGVNNDIYTWRADVKIQDGGTYSFGGGIVTENGIFRDGTLDIGAADQDGSPNVTFEDGSISNLDGALDISNGATVTLKSGASFVVGSSLNVVGTNTTLVLGNNITSLSTGSLTVSEYGSLVLNVGDGTFAPFEVSGAATLAANSTVTLDFEKSFDPTKETEIHLFTVGETFTNDTSNVGWKNLPVERDLSVELFSRPLGTGTGVYARITSNSNPNPVPEPTTWGMLLLGLATLAIYARRKRNNA